jgi:hypothetical protein
MKEIDQVCALFWCSLLRPLIEGKTEPEDALRCPVRKRNKVNPIPPGQRRASFKLTETCPQPTNPSTRSRKKTTLTLGAFSMRAPAKTQIRPC